MQISYDRPNDLIYIAAGDLTPDETLQVKQLPGRVFDRDRWIIPIRPGLGAAWRSAIANGDIANFIEELEALSMERYKAPPVFVYDLWNIPAAEAIQRAAVGTLMLRYGGDLERYNRVFSLAIPTKTRSKNGRTHKA